MNERAFTISNVFLFVSYSDRNCKMSQPNGENTTKKQKKNPEQTQSKADVDLNALLLAIKDVKLNHKSKQATANTYNIKRTNLRRYLNRLDDEVPDITALLHNH